MPIPSMFRLSGAVAMAVALSAVAPGAQAQIKTYVGTTSQGYPVTVYLLTRSGKLQFLAETVAMRCERAPTLLNPFIYANARRRGTEPVPLLVDDFGVDTRGSLQFFDGDTRIAGTFSAVQAAFVDVDTSVREVNRCASGSVNFEASLSGQTAHRPAAPDRPPSARR